MCRSVRVESGSFAPIRSMWLKVQAWGRRLVSRPMSSSRTRPDRTLTALFENPPHVPVALAIAYDRVTDGACSYRSPDVDASDSLHLRALGVPQHALLHDAFGASGLCFATSFFFCLQRRVLISYRRHRACLDSDKMLSERRVQLGL